MQTTNVLGLKKPEKNEFYHVEDTNYNSDAVDALFEKDANGSVMAKNAKTLDGHGAEYFASAEAVNKKSTLDAKLLNTSILEEALSIQTNGVHEYILGGTDYTADDIPSTGAYAYGNATVKVRYNFREVILWGATGQAPIFNAYSAGAWSGWKTLATRDDLANYLPKTGGELSGTLSVKALLEVVNTYNNPVRHSVKNNSHSVSVHVSDAGNGGLFDDTHNKWLVKSDASGNVTLNGTASGNLPKTTGYIESAPTSKDTQTFNIGTPFSILGIEFPKYAKGVMVTNNSDDASLIVVDNEGRARVAFRNNGEWYRASILARMTDLANYLPLTNSSAPEVKTNSSNTLALRNTSGTKNHIHFYSSNADLGYLGFNEANKPVFQTTGGINRELLHTGNFPVEEGTFSLTYGSVVLSGFKYIKMGKFVYLYGGCSTPSTFTVPSMKSLSGIPFTPYASAHSYVVMTNDTYSPSNDANKTHVFGIGSAGITLADETTFNAGEPISLTAMYVTA